VQCEAAFSFLSKHLEDYHQQKIVILVDEYDTLVHAAYTLEAALRQIRERRCSAELRAAGAQPIREVGVVFDGKRAGARFQEPEPAA